MIAKARELPVWWRGHRKPLFIGLFFILLAWLMIGRLSHHGNLHSRHLHISRELHKPSLAQTFQQHEEFGPDSTSKTEKSSVPSNELTEIPKTNKHAYFKHVGDGTFIYSAYFDRRHKHRPVVKIIGIADQKDSKYPFYCHLHYEDVNIPVITKAEFLNLDIYNINDHRPYRYNSSMFICNVTSSKTPSHVSLTKGHQESPEILLPIITNNPRKVKDKKNFTVCYHQALKYNYSNQYQFVESVEVNRQMGADAFVIYNHSGSPIIRPYILHYMQSGTFDVYSWPMSDDLSNNTFNYGQSAIINDCLYRYMYRTEYLVFIDFDEQMVPKKHNTWSEALSTFTCEGNWSTSIFKNSFFRLDYSKDKSYLRNTTLMDTHLNTLSRTLRDNYTWPCSKRSKYIARPTQVFIAGVHSAHDAKGPICCVPEDLALLHHYRFWNKKYPTYWAWKERLEKQGQKRLATVNVRDRSMWRFSDVIYRRVMSVHITVNQSAHLVEDAERLVPWWR